MMHTHSWSNNDGSSTIFTGLQIGRSNRSISSISFSSRTRRLDRDGENEGANVTRQRIGANRSLQDHHQHLQRAPVGPVDLQPKGLTSHMVLHVLSTPFRCCRSEWRRVGSAGERRTRAKRHEPAGIFLLWKSDDRQRLSRLVLCCIIVQCFKHIPRIIWVCYCRWFFTISPMLLLRKREKQK